MGLYLFTDPVGHFELSRRWWYCRRCGVGGGAALQAVRRCRRCGVAGAERVPPSPLGWYYYNIKFYWASSPFTTINQIGTKLTTGQSLRTGITDNQLLYFMVNCDYYYNRSRDEIGLLLTWLKIIQKLSLANLSRFFVGGKNHGILATWRVSLDDTSFAFSTTILRLTTVDI